jgi:hypothetical protein
VLKRRPHGGAEQRRQPRSKPHLLLASHGSEGPEASQSGELAKAIDAQRFASFAKFEEEFTRAALTRFGSGWAWLTVDMSKQLAVRSTANQDTPLSGRMPILGIDVRNTPTTQVSEPPARLRRRLPTTSSTGTASARLTPQKASGFCFHSARIKACQTGMSIEQRSKRLRHHVSAALAYAAELARERALGAELTVVKGVSPSWVHLRHTNPATGP